jgi:cellobiose transport system permease protein
MAQELTARGAWRQYIAISPFYILFAVFGLIPVVFSIWLSFHQWNGIGAMKWVGLAQYSYLLSDSEFWHSIATTLIIWVVNTVPMLVLALILAFALHTTVRFKGFYRVAYFVPNITSMVAMAIVFGSLFATQAGLLNAGLQWLGAQAGIGWLTDPRWIKIAVASMVTWRWVGYNAIIYLAGLQAIPTDVYEAAKVDGANSVQTFLRVTVPMLRPVILFTVITSTIGGLQIFTESQVLLGNTGGPENGGETIVLYLYNQAFVKNQFGYGSAVAWALFLLIVLFSVINWRLLAGNDNPVAREGRRRRG